jgi:single-strand DNA-binding protein
MHSKVELIGRLGKPPEMRYTAEGQPVTKLSIATNRQWKGASGEDMQETTWWRVSVWGKLAEACNDALDKGSLVFVEGRIQPDPKTGGPRIWVDDQAIVHASYEITAQHIRFLSRKEEQGSEETGADEIPF